MCVVIDSDAYLGGKCQEHPQTARAWGSDRIREFVQSPEFRPHYDITGKNSEIRVRDLYMKTDDRNPRMQQKYVGARRNITVSVSGQDHFHVHVH